MHGSVATATCEAALEDAVGNAAEDAARDVAWEEGGNASEGAADERHKHLHGMQKGAAKKRVAKGKKKKSPGEAMLQQSLSAAGEADTPAARAAERDPRDRFGNRNPEINDGDVIALYDSRRALYWTCEDNTLGGGCAIKLKARGRELSEGNKFKVVLAPIPAAEMAAVAEGMKPRARFALKALYNGKLVHPNFRGRFHVDVEHDEEGKALTKSANLFSAVHDRQACGADGGDVRPGEATRSKKLATVQLWHKGDEQWLFTHDSEWHRDPRVGMCGSIKDPCGTHYKVLWIARGTQLREQEARAMVAEEALARDP